MLVLLVGGLLVSHAEQGVENQQGIHAAGGPKLWIFVSKRERAQITKRMESKNSCLKVF